MCFSSYIQPNIKFWKIKIILKVFMQVIKNNQPPLGLLNFVQHAGIKHKQRDSLSGFLSTFYLNGNTILIKGIHLIQFC